MHLLYVDESGSVEDPGQKFFVLAGVSVFERKTHWIEQKLNDIAALFDAANPHEIELHGSPMRSGREGWKRFSLDRRLKAIEIALEQGIVINKKNDVKIFGAVVNKESLVDVDPIEYAFEQISSRFDQYLRRLYIQRSDPQRGIILFDKSKTERRIQTLARDFKYNGHSWGAFRNYAEVPVFLDSKASRLIQLADLVAYSMHRFYENGDDQFYKIIRNCFDSDGGIVHGLHEKL